AEAHDSRRAVLATALGAQEWRERNATAAGAGQAAIFLIDANHTSAHLFDECEPDRIVMQRDRCDGVRWFERYVHLFLAPRLGVGDIQLPLLWKLALHPPHEVFNIALGDGGDRTRRVHTDRSRQKGAIVDEKVRMA